MTYKIQIDNETRDATEAETKHIDKIKADALARSKAQAAQAAARKAVLDKLGITADEAELLLG
jgi:hypothetical protein